jgi:RimJ/RimL family protein N-acetyltransferase
MVNPKELWSATLEAGRGLVRAGHTQNVEEAHTHIPSIVPIRTLGPRHRAKIQQHLLGLSDHDRYLRFGYMANESQIQRYIDSIDFAIDDVFGIYNRKLELLAMAHLAHAKENGYEKCVEFGVSVVVGARGRGYGARLFQRAAIHASNDGVRMMFIHALSENAVMLRIAKKAGATIERDGSESEAYLTLPSATLDSQLTEMIEEQIAQTDYSLKVQARQFWSLLAELQEVRKGAIEALRRSGR